MKILQITPYYLPHTGGIERYVYNLSQYLISQGHTVDIATANMPESSDKETVEGVTIYRYPNLCTLMGNPIITNLSDLKSRMKEYDIVHIHGVYTYAALRTALFLGRKHQQKVFLTHHGRVVYPNSPKNILAKIYEQVFVRFVLNRVDKAVVLSESDREHFFSLGMPKDKISIIPNGIDTKVFVRPDSQQLEEFKNRLGVKSPIILYLAVISERKGIFDLIRAFENINDNKYTLLVVGDGPDKGRAVELAESLNLTDRIIFTGKLSFSDLICAYSSAEVYVLPSYFEGMPTTVMEALVLGCPVIATDIPGVKDNFKDVATLVPPGDATTLAKTIEEILQNKPVVNSDALREKYEGKKVFEKYDKIYE